MFDIHGLMSKLICNSQYNNRKDELRKHKNNAVMRTRVETFVAENHEYEDTFTAVK